MKTLGLAGYALQALFIVGAIFAGMRGSDYLPSPLEDLQRQLSAMASGMENAGIVLAGWIGRCFPALIGMGFFATYLRQEDKRREGAWLMAVGFAHCLAMVFWPLVIR